jgi:hypothetical protein
MKESFSDFQKKMEKYPLLQWPSETPILAMLLLDSANDGPEVEIIRRELGDDRFKIQIDWSSL